MTLTAATLALRKLVEANLGVVERGQGTGATVNGARAGWTPRVLAGVQLSA